MIVRKNTPFGRLPQTDGGLGLDPADPAYVRIEASDRIARAVGASNAYDLSIKLSNNSREMIRLLTKGETKWSDAEAARFKELQDLDHIIENIRAKSNVLDKLDPIPPDYRDDKYWEMAPVVTEVEVYRAPRDADGFAILTAVQVRLALNAVGIFASKIDAIIDAIPDALMRENARAYWDNATEVHRKHPLIETMAGALGLSDEKVDYMWEQASKVT